MAISGQTAFLTDGSVIYVFNEPAGGWSGTMHESATLAATTNAQISSIAVSSNTLVATTQDAAYVFTEPAGGWAGALHQSATLVLSSRFLVGFSGAAAISGPVIVAGGGALADNSQAVAIWREPPGGWSATHQESAILSFQRPDPELLGPNVAISGSTVAFTTATPGGLGAEHECPCPSDIYAVAEPATGWSGTTAITAAGGVSPVDGGPNLAINGQTLAVTANDGVHILTANRSQTRLAHVTLTGLETAAPRLQFTATTGRRSAAIKAFALAFPAGLAFSSSPKRLRAGVSITGSSVKTAVVRQGALIVTLEHPAKTLSVTISNGAISETRQLVHTIQATARYNASAQSKRRRVVQLALPLRLTDTGGTLTSVSIRASLT